jgi:hypothetical protein
VVVKPLGEEREKWPANQKGKHQTEIADFSGGCCVIPHSTPGGGVPPTTAAPISHRQSTIFYQLPATASSTLASANFALPTCSPTTRSNLFQPLRGGHPPIRKRESRKPKTLQKCQQSNHIKPHQPGGDPDFELDSTRPPIPRLSTITYQLSSPARPSLCYR